MRPERERERERERESFKTREHILNKEKRERKRKREREEEQERDITFSASCYCGSALLQCCPRHRERGRSYTATARGFEPLRAEPNGFLVHHLQT